MYGNQVMLICINTVFSAIAIISTLTRALAGRTRHVKPQSDDILAYLAMFFNIGQITIVYLMITRGGAGKPMDKMTPTEFASFEKLTSIVQLFYGLTMGGTRASIVCLEMQIFKFTRWMKWICRATLGLIACWTIYTIIQTFAMCRPFAANWDKSIPHVCGDELASLLGIVIYGLILDLIIFITPMPSIWKLQMPLKQKIGLTLLFAIGLFDIVTGIMRMVVTVDGVFDIITQALVWATLEPAIAIWVANLPKCWKTFDQLIPRELFSNISFPSLLSSRRNTVRADGKSLDSEQTSMSEQTQWERPTAPFDYQPGQRGSGYRSSAHHVPQDDTASIPEGQVAVRRDYDTHSEKATPAPMA